MRRLRRPRGDHKKNCSKCGGPLEATRIGKQRYCLSCHSAHMRENRKSYNELTESAKKKACARSYAKLYLRRWGLHKQPCVICGNAAQMHHPDYNKPLEVIWLCRDHHLQIHLTPASLISKAGFQALPVTNLVILTDEPYAKYTSPPKKATHAAARTSDCHTAPPTGFSGAAQPGPAPSVPPAK